MKTMPPPADRLDPVWPRIAVEGDLERARPEWLHTNGAGAFASSTIAQMHERRYHGLLVAALDPPRGRHVILSHLDAVLESAGARFDLATHHFPDIPPTGGYRHLLAFAQDPLPRWTFACGEGRLEQRLALARGRNVVVVRWAWQGDEPATLVVRPLLALRPFHSLMREHGSMIQEVEVRQGEMRVRPVPTMPRVVFGHGGTFIGSPDWWRRFEYGIEKARGLDREEDLWTPGVFRLPLAPDGETWMIVSLDALPEEAAPDLMRATETALLAEDPGPSRPPLARRLAVAAEAFRADLAPSPGVVAGYPWFEVWGRDSLISLPGLYLVPGRIEEARRVLRSLVAYMADGLVPNRVPDAGEPAQYNTADATLWLFETARLWAARVGENDPFLLEELAPALQAAFEAALAGTRNGIHVTEAGLFAAGAPGLALTWMDAKVGDWVVTPRVGCPVELQALWASGCGTLARLARLRGDEPLAARAERARERAVAAFRRAFWCEATGFPYDVVPAHAGAGGAPDASIRPNAVIALAVEPALFDPAQAASIVAVSERLLVTPAGLRTLAPGSPGYVPHYAGGVVERDGAYHQGTVWPWLLGFHVRAALRLRPDDAEERERLRELVASAASHTLAVGQVPEIADADPPHAPNGCPAQAWSVAELLRAIAWDLA